MHHWQNLQLPQSLNCFISRRNFEKKYTKADVFSTSKNMIEGLTVVAVKSGHTFKCYEQIEENDIVRYTYGSLVI